jgi:hypothetical protein
MNDNTPNKPINVNLTRFYEALNRFEQDLQHGCIFNAYRDLYELRQLLDFYHVILTDELNRPLPVKE